jgi:hypothetical protein
MKSKNKSLVTICALLFHVLLFYWAIQQMQ